ncbi:hypothetical protein HC928_08835 [bacterium]|nr:hypothetical protein [bacterium]
MALFGANAAQNRPLTRLQRWAHYLTMLTFGLGLLYGINMLQSLQTATIGYVDVRAGISVRYPVNWLFDDDGSYIFRVRDMTRIGYKTTLQISVRPIGTQSSAEIVLNNLALQRSTQLNQYRTLSITPASPLNDQPAVAMTYLFTTTEVDAALESLPIVVLGRDVLVILRGQAVIITFTSDVATFDQDLAIFDRFLDSLELQ